MKKIIIVPILFLLVFPVFAQPLVRFRSAVEIGFADIYAHTIRFGEGASGTDFDYVSRGGQDILFPFKRISADIEIGNHMIFTLLYQPINLLTAAWNASAFNMSGTTFPANSVLDLRYGFDFYRLSWMYDFFKEPDRILGIGLSLQIRDAVITFATGDGQTLVANSDVGPVPLLKFRYQENIGDMFWIGVEVDGIYANIKILNGSVENEITGSLLDASIRAGAHISKHFDVYLNYRFVGGGAKGPDVDEALNGDADDGYTDNQIAFGTVSLGVIIK